MQVRDSRGLHGPPAAPTPQSELKFFVFRHLATDQIKRGSLHEWRCRGGQPFPSLGPGRTGLLKVSVGEAKSLPEGHTRPSMQNILKNWRDADASEIHF
jgi:hypothetical protein